MSIKCEKIVEAMKEIAPEYLAEPWDNIGLLVGNKNSIVKKVVIALDATNEVIDEAIEINADLIITHHPLSIKHIKRFTSDTLGGKLYKLIQNNICVYSAHTNFDIVKGGINDILASKLKINIIDVLESTYTTNNNSETYGIGRIGTLEKETSLLDYAKFIKSQLNLSYINVVGDTSKLIKKVAVCSGNGSDYLEKVVQKGADLYISGDVKYHDAKLAQEMGLCWIDATHYASENIAMPALKELLDKKSKLENWKIEIFESKINGQPFTII